MPDQVPESLKTERSRRLENLNRHMKEFYRKQLEGKRAEVLIEENEDGMWIGHTVGYVRQRYGVSILMINRDRTDIRPSDDTQIELNDALLLMEKQEQKGL